MKLGINNARIAYLQSEPHFAKIKLNVLRCIPLKRRLKLLENYEEHARDLLEESFIADYIDEFNEIKISNDAKSLPLLDGIRKYLEPDIVHNDQRIKDFMTRLVVTFEYLGEYHFTN